MCMYVYGRLFRVNILDYCSCKIFIRICHTIDDRPLYLIKTWSGNLTNVFVLSFCSCLC